MFHLLLLPIRLPLKIAKLAVRLTGISNTLLIGIGVAIGLLIAPTTGAEMRQRLQQRLDDRRNGGIDSRTGMPASDPPGI